MFFEQPLFKMLMKRGVVTLRRTFPQLLSSTSLVHEDGCSCVLFQVCTLVLVVVSLLEHLKKSVKIYMQCSTDLIKRLVSVALQLIEKSPSHTCSKVTRLALRAAFSTISSIHRGEHCNELNTRKRMSTATLIAYVTGDREKTKVERLTCWCFWGFRYLNGILYPICGQGFYAKDVGGVALDAHMDAHMDTYSKVITAREWTPPDYQAVSCGGNDLCGGKCSGRDQRKPGSSKLRQI
ncbi:hypothetical protein Y032_0718g1801 [Ancylostoma ceylanicum]|uniref:Uncharacterized protein n=1 Tax=Ancylostoma ceylanicum TaxID=53326 RepID=A0A016WHC1_9BILA|nr:hypothetical protein Y032_0718g1801 [Ancylostoma ceylanicum]